MLKTVLVRMTNFLMLAGCPDQYKTFELLFIQIRVLGSVQNNLQTFQYFLMTFRVFCLPLSCCSIVMEDKFLHYFGIAYMQFLNMHLLNSS